MGIFITGISEKVIIIWYNLLYLEYNKVKVLGIIKVLYCRP